MINNQIVFVTGGAHGIGRGIVEAFLAAGAQVAFCDCDLELDERTARETGAAFYPADGFIDGQNIVIDGGMTKKMIYEE